MLKKIQGFFSLKRVVDFYSLEFIRLLLLAHIKHLYWLFIFSGFHEQELNSALYFAMWVNVIKVKTIQAIATFSDISLDEFKR